MKLKKWLKQEKITQRRFAEILGKSEITVSRWIKGYQKPEHADTETIYRITNGAVTPNDFYNLTLENSK